MSTGAGVGSYSSGLHLIPEETNSTLVIGVDPIKTRQQWECPYAAKWRMVNKTTGESHDFDCKSWRCPVHGPKLHWRWLQRLGFIPWELMLTFTLVPDDRRVARLAWTALVRWMRARGVHTYVRTMEYGSRTGMRHWHALVAGTGYIDHAQLSKKAEEVGLGPNVWIARVKDKRGAASYLLKYALKALGEYDTRRDGWRCITASRNVPSWTAHVAILKKNTSVDEVLTDDSGRAMMPEYELKKG